MPFGKIISMKIKLSIFFILNSIALFSQEADIVFPCKIITDSILSNSIRVSSGVILDTISGIKLLGNSTVYDDFEIDLASLKSLGALAKPDFDVNNLTFDFPINDTTEMMGKAIETQHDWQEQDTIWFHLHYDQTQNLIPGFRIQYKIYNRGEAEPTTWTRITSTGNLYSYTSGTIHNMLLFPAVLMTGKTISCIIKVKLYRYDNTYTGDCKVTRFAYHYKINTLGSKSQGNK